MYEIDVSISRDKVHKSLICFIQLFCVGMICVSKECEIKTKQVQEQWLATAKNDILIFLLGWLFPHTSYSKVAILLLQDLSTLCVTDINGIYFHLSVQCS